MKYTFYVFLCFCFQIAWSQNTKIDSLKNELERHPEKDSVRVYLLNTIAFSNYGVDYKALKKYTDEAYSLAKDIHFIKGEARSLYMLCVYYLSQNNLEKALEAIHNSLELYEEINNTAGISTCYDLIGTISNYQGHYDVSITYYNKAIVLAKNQGHEVNVANYLNNIGSVNSAKGDYDQAIASYNKALKIYERLNVFKETYSTINNIALIYTRQGKYSGALDNFQKCLSYYKKENNKLGIASTLLNIGAVYSYLENHVKAIEYRLESLEVNKELGDEFGMSKTMIGLSNSYVATEDYENAYEMLHEALVISKRINRKTMMHNCYHGLGNLNSKLEKYQDALINFKEALKLSEELGKKRTISKSHIDIGKTYYNLKVYGEAYKHAVKGKEIADQLLVVEIQKDANLLLSKLHEERNDYKQALRSFRVYKEQNDSVFNKKNIEKITQLEYEYKYKEELEAADRRESELSNEVKVVSTNLERSQQNVLVAVIVFLVVALVLSAIIFYLKLRNARARTENIMVEQKLLRSQMSPHFVFNALSVLQGMVLNSESKKSVLYLSKFSKLLRITLENSRDKMVALSQELLAVENYVALQNIESGNAYQFNVDIDASIDTSSFQIPPMLIQPFVENAIEHGFESQSGEKRIAIQIRFETNKLICVITDNGIGVDAQKKTVNEQKKSLATTITAERLEILSKATHVKGSICIEDRKKYDQQGTIVTMVIPYKNKRIV